jgi:hypothetical protein
MVKFDEDTDGERIFYFCRNCGNRSTYLVTVNGLSEDWPSNIFDEAVRRGAYTKEGKLLWL